MWSYRLALPAASFSMVVGWLTLNHGGLVVLLLPNSGEGPARPSGLCTLVGQVLFLELGGL